jgi:hypothetical protein
MTEYLIAGRAMLNLWTNLAMMPAEILFDAIEAELERRGVEPKRALCNSTTIGTKPRPTLRLIFTQREQSGSMK